VACKQSFIVTLPITTADWTPVLAPLACNYFLIIGNVDGSAFLRCTDPTDANSSYQIPAGGWFSFLAPWTPPNCLRFQKNDRVELTEKRRIKGQAFAEKMRARQARP
jgi:hypothetical protein